MKIIRFLLIALAGSFWGWSSFAQDDNYSEVLQKSMSFFDCNVQENCLKTIGSTGAEIRGWKMALMLTML